MGEELYSASIGSNGQTFTHFHLAEVNPATGELNRIGTVYAHEAPHAGALIRIMDEAARELKAMARQAEARRNLEDA